MWLEALILEVHLQRDEIARYGLSIEAVQNTVAAAIGGVEVTRTVEGRERYPVRVRYQRERRDDIESMLNVLVSTPTGAQIPLADLATIEFQRGPADDPFGKHLLNRLRNLWCGEWFC